MRKVVVGAAKAFIPKAAVGAVGLFLLFSIPSAAQETQNLMLGGFNAQSFNECQEALVKQCPDSSESCLMNQITHTPSCAQTRLLYGLTHLLPVAAENYDNIDVVQLKSLSLPRQINYVIVGKTGEVILPKTDIAMENAPGFLALKTAYPNVQLVAQILDYPQAVFLTENIQQLVLQQPLFNAATQQYVGYVKVLYTFTLDGQYKGQHAMRVVMYTNS